MGGDDIAQVIYLTLLACVIGGYFFISQRENLGQTVRHAALWGLIFLGVVAAYGLWNDVSRDLVPSMTISQDGGQIELPREADGHYYMTLEIENTPVTFVVDTGATEIVLSLQDAERIGIDTQTLAFDGRASTANGTVRTARVTLRDVRLDDTSEGSLAASVNEGALDTSLLGMSYLSRFSSVELRGDRMFLTR